LQVFFLQIKTFFSMSLKKTLLASDLFLIWITVSLIYIFIQLLMNTYVLTEDVFIESYSGILASEQIISILKAKEEWGWISYFIPLVYIPIKALFTAAALLVGLVLYNKEMDFKLVYKVVLLAESVFILATIVQFVGLVFFIHPQTINELNSFAPLTLASIVTIEDFPKWITPLLYGVSLYELFYVLALSYFISDDKDLYVNWIAPISASYLIWFIFIYSFLLYLSLQLNPA